MIIWVQNTNLKFSPFLDSICKLLVDPGYSAFSYSIKHSKSNVSMTDWTYKLCRREGWCYSFPFYNISLHMVEKLSLQVTLHNHKLQHWGRWICNKKLVHKVVHWLLQLSTIMYKGLRILSTKNTLFSGKFLLQLV